MFALVLLCKIFHKVFVSFLKIILFLFSIRDLKRFCFDFYFSFWKGSVISSRKYLQKFLVCNIRVSFIIYNINYIVFFLVSQPWWPRFHTKLRTPSTPLHIIFLICIDMSIVSATISELHLSRSFLCLKLSDLCINLYLKNEDTSIFFRTLSHLMY